MTYNCLIAEAISNFELKVRNNHIDKDGLSTRSLSESSTLWCSYKPSRGLRFYLHCKQFSRSFRVSESFAQRSLA